MLDERKMIKSDIQRKSGGYIYAYKIVGENWVKVGYTKYHCRTRMEDYSERHNLISDPESLLQARLLSSVNPEMVEFVLHQRMKKHGFLYPIESASEVFSFPSNCNNYDAVIEFLGSQLGDIIGAPIDFVTPPPRTQKQLEWRNQNLTERWEKLRDVRVWEERQHQRHIETSKNLEEVKQRFKNAGVFGWIGVAADLMSENSQTFVEKSHQREERMEVAGFPRLQRLSPESRREPIPLPEIDWTQIDWTHWGFEREGEDAKEAERKKKFEEVEKTKQPCSCCGALILPATIARNNGKCAVCIQPGDISNSLNSALIGAKAIAYVFGLMSVASAILMVVLLGL